MSNDPAGRPSMPPKSGTVPGLRDAFKKAVTELLVLRLLRDREMYAYEMQREMERRSGGVLTFHTLYLAIYRLKDRGFLEERGKETAGGRERIYLGITEAGQRRYEEAAAEYRRLTAAVDQILSPEGDGSEGGEEK